MGDEQKLESLAKKIRVCPLCELQHARQEAVPGEGSTIYLQRCTSFRSSLS